ncbi:tetratricopeptide repeat-containing sensor histidine kinase [Flavilitoribacter nigricans]|uniref:histidine kinase n=1 Tax=Flavilitoribacter nigricans (strain ATCC 23147 / DSM 23189 / NBRC 102662 / NCIMB 1420 / SS-2) TaxID=1122177 RepID=A0A2D0NC90_FLAN2|nr:histidine kinase [Flavilitoribacter nigricans]PHN06121.1 hypothetical protein CRP01_14230 [Flavilitoribacter nigricans DSM 23189 = NBRC 102662]
MKRLKRHIAFIAFSAYSRISLLSCLVAMGVFLPSGNAQSDVQLEQVQQLLQPLARQEQHTTGLVQSISDRLGVQDWVVLQTYLPRIKATDNRKQRLDIIYDFARGIFYANDNRQAAALLMHQLLEEKEIGVLTAKIYLLLGWIDKREQAHETAIEQFRESIRILEAFPDSATYAESCNLLGSCYLDVQEFIPAVDYLSRSIHYADAVDSTYRYKILYNMSLLYNRLGDTTRIKNTLKEVIQGSEQYDIPQLELLAYMGLISMYQKLNNHQKIIELCREAIDLSQSRKVFRSIGYVYYHRAMAQLALGQTDSALVSAREGLFISEHLDQKREIQNCHFALSSILFQQQHYRRALSHLDTITPDAEATANRQLLLRAHELYARIYYQLGRYREAYDHLRLSKEMDYEINHPEQEELLQAQVSRYESQKDVAELQRLKMVQTETELNLQKTRATRNFILAFSIISLLSLLLVFNSYRFRKTRQMSLLKDRFYQDLHDHVGSSLTRIKLLLARYIRKSQPSEAERKELDRIREISNRVMFDMYDLLWSLNSDKELLSDMCERISGHLEHALAPLDIRYTFRHDQADPNLKLNASLKNHLYGIFKESINNAIKHAAPREIQVLLSSSRQPKRIHLSIINDIHIDASELNRDGAGTGLTNMEKRIRTLKGEMKTYQTEHQFELQINIMVK